MRHAIDSIIRFCGDTVSFLGFLIELICKKGFSKTIKEKHNGTVAILANGPSLKEILPSLTISDDFKGVDFIVMNFFAFDEAFFQIKPKHYCLADPMYFIENYRLEKVNDVKKLFEILQNNVSWKMNIYLPSRLSKKFVAFSGVTNKNISIVTLSSVDYRGYESFRNVFYKKGLAMPFLGTVANMAIYTGINCGYSKIMLYGVDHSFFDNLCVNEMNQLCTKDVHFYDGDASMKPILDGNKDVMKISNLMSFYAALFKSHDYLSFYAKYSKTEVINCTLGSLIDSYPKKSPAQQN